MGTTAVQKSDGPHGIEEVFLNEEVYKLAVVIGEWKVQDKVKSYSQTLQQKGMQM